MTKKTRNFIRIASPVFGVLISLGISSCGKVDHSAGSAFNNPQFLSQQFFIEKNINVQFPAPDIIPQIKYTPINSVFANPSDITEGKNTEEILLKLRSISSLTKAYHQELYEIVKNAMLIDLSHLVLIADAGYFPNETYDQMKKILGDPRSCGNLAPEACQKKLDQVKNNIISANEFGIYINKVLTIGREKLAHVDPKEAFSILSKSYPQLDSTNVLFKETLNGLDDLKAEEKLAFIDLAILKSALAPALKLALDWFKNDSDKTSESLIFIANKFPLSEMRDQVLASGLDIVSNITPKDAKQFAMLAINPLNIINLSLNKISIITAHDIKELASVCKNPNEQDAVITLGVSKIKSASTDEAIELILNTNSNKAQIAKTLIAIIPDLKPADLVFLVKNATYGKDREEIILTNINRFTSLSADEARLLADGSQNPLRIVLTLLPKIDVMTAMGLARVVEVINLGTERDIALLNGISFVQSADVAGVVAILKLAYSTKISATTTMLTKLTSLSANELALISKECIDPATRDQLLLKGSSFLSTASLESTIAIVGLANLEKVNIALSVIPKIPNVSANDFGSILKSIADGKTRDRLINSGLGLLKSYDGTGAALIVDRSFEFKFETATKLLALIPQVTGSDLDKMLAVCGSGNTRDLILGNGIKLLTKLTKEEARSLYSRAYDNKDSVAVLLISKIENIDGQTVGEIARFSNKGATRDLIIAEGLKRLPKIDAAGLIVMIQTSYKLTEKLALEVSDRIENFTLDNAFDIATAIANLDLKDRFLIHSVDLLEELDESMITMLALRATSRSAKVEIVTKGVLKIGNTP